MLRLQSKSQGSVAIDIEKARTSIGRDSGNHLVLDDDRVSGFHATVFTEGDRVEIVDLGSTNGTEVNGKAVSGRLALKPWDRVCIGGVELELVDTEGRRPTRLHAAIRDDDPRLRPAQGAPGDLPKAVLRLVSGGNCPPELTVRDRVTVGREGENTYNLGATTVSGRHAELVPATGGVELIDLGSSNGTFVNGGRIARQLLRQGDRVRFDDVEYVVDLPGAARGDSGSRLSAGGTVLRPAIPNDAGATGPTAVHAAVGANPAMTVGSHAIPSGMGEAPRPRPDATVRGVAVDPPPSYGDYATEAVQPQAQRQGWRWLLFSPDGRLPRLPFFLTSLLLVGVGGVVAIFALIAGQAAGSRNPTTILSLAAIGPLLVLWPSIVLQVKRLHDIDAHGAWVLVGVANSLIGLITGIAKASGYGLAVTQGTFGLQLGLLLLLDLLSLVYGLVLLLAPGSPGPNKYGAPVDRVL